LIISLIDLKIIAFSLTIPFINYFPNFLGSQFLKFYEFKLKIYPNSLSCTILKSEDLCGNISLRSSFEIPLGERAKQRII